MAPDRAAGPGLRVDLDRGPGAAAPWQQVHDQVVAAVDDGVLTPGDRLPTVRGLAEQLGVSAGTVARANRALEASDVVATASRAGTVVRDRAAPRCGAAGRREAGRRGGPVAAARRAGGGAGPLTRRGPGPAPTSPGRSPRRAPGAGERPPEPGAGRQVVVRRASWLLVPAGKNPPERTPCAGFR